MTDNIIHERYRELATASITQGVNDWLGNKEADDYELYKWLQDCEWFDYLGLDREYFFVRILDLRRRGVKKIMSRGWMK